MKRLILTFLVVLSLILIALNGIQYFIPYYWGNKSFKKKVNHCQPLADYNSVFIGNSKVFHHVIPSLFDSLTNEPTKSINLASDAANIFEIKHLISGFLKKHRAKKIFVLVNGGYSGIDKQNLYTPRSIYFWNFQSFYAAIKYFEFKLDTTQEYIKLYLSKFLLLGQGPTLLDFYLKKEQYDCGTKGYFPLYNSVLKEDDTKFRRGLAMNRRKNLKESFIKRPLNTNELIIKEQIQLIEQAVQAADSELYLIFNPNTEFHYALDYERSIYMGDGKDFPMYFSLEYRYDRGHLNDKGAHIFTTRLAQIYNDLK